MSLRVQNQIDPEHLMINREEYSHLEEKISEILSELEQQVLALYLEGQSYNEISEELNRHVKSIDNALQTSKTEIRTSFRIGEMI